jgi:hypothetical protein
VQRSRKIAAAPERPAPESWATLAGLIEESVGRSEQIEAAEIEASMEVARGVGTILIAGGHLDRHPITVIAGELHLSLTTVSGDAALALEENLKPVMGATKASAWKVYLPTPDPLGSAIKKVTKSDPNLSTEDPPDSAAAESAASSSLLDPDALRGTLG